MADTLTPAVLNEVIARGDTYEGTWSIEAGTLADGSDAVPVDISARTYRLTVRHPLSGAVLAQVTTDAAAAVPAGAGVITRTADGVTGRLRFRVDQAVTAGWPVDGLKRDLEETNGADVQTLFLGTLTVREDQSR